MSQFESKHLVGKTLSIDLIGGIGNQLFRYHAAMYIADKLNLKVIFFLGELPASHSQFNSRILDLGYSINPGERPLPGCNWLFTNKLLAYLSMKSYTFRKVVNVLRGIHCESGQDISMESNLISKQFGRFPYPSNIHLEGHFQDISYFSHRTSIDIKTSPRKSLDTLSSNIILQNKNFELENLCVVHIRRGDFKNHISDIGLLSKEYYEKSMTNFILAFQHPHFLIISDDMSEAETMIADRFRHLCTFYKDSEKMNPASLIKILSPCRNFILSNSTYSVWMALLATDTKYVAYPYPFNRDLALNVRGFPESWTPESSHFEQLLPSEKL